MTVPDLGPWAPMSVDDVVERLSAAPFRWWLSGARALELHVGRRWRDHGDTDVGVVRAELPEVFAWFAEWDLHVAASGRLSPWGGELLDGGIGQNNVWCRRGPAEPWVLDLTIGDGSPSEWIFRRDRSVRVPWDRAVLRTVDDVPYLAPELQLLFKSKSPRPKDDVDAREVIPVLAPDRRARFRELLSADHPWTRLIDSAG